MHPLLKNVLDQSVEIFRQDERILAACLHGSCGTSNEDELSDVDPVFYTRPEEFEAVDRDLKPIFEKLCGDIVLWWPERINCDTLKNYAILFSAGDKLLHYDMEIRVAPAEGKVRVPPSQVLFDKAGLLDVVEEPATVPAYTPERLTWHMEMYWIYVFIHAKYLLRGEPFRLRAVQRELFDNHLEILRALRGDVRAEWWPDVARRVTDDSTRDDLLAYFGQVDAKGIAAALPGQIDAFASHARAACRKWDQSYPEMLENKIRAYLQKALDRIS